MNQALSPDTEVVLLLCGRFGGERQESFKPLSAREYGELAKWLKTKSIRPADLLNDSGKSAMADVSQAKLDPTRMGFLLGRGTALALALERWSRGGLWVISRADPEYPKRLKKHLKHVTPPLLYGAGDRNLLDVGGLAIIGSRDASETSLAFSREIATRCAHEGLGVVSGGARGIDSAAMQGATEAGGVTIGILANDLLKACLNRQNRMGLQDGNLVLISPFFPEAGFNAGNAMARNKYIYTMADQALVVDTAHGSGGTWAGATENIQHGWVPLYVRLETSSAGNTALVQQGGLAFDFEPKSGVSLRNFFANADVLPLSEPVQLPQKGLLFASQPSPLPLPADVPETVLAPEREVVNMATNEPEATVARSPTSSFDLFTVFMDKLRSLLDDAPLADVDIASALSIEKGQTKVWLKRAVDEQQVEKLKNPVRYSLRKQASLC